jgi:hypothetical protein
VVQGEEQGVLFTNKLKPAHVAQLPVSVDPSIYQRNIPKAYKAYEVRVTVVGQEVFAAAVDSQATVTTQQNWRRVRLPFRAYELPVAVADKCVALVQALQLRFGAIDLRWPVLFLRNQSKRAVGLGGAGLWPADFPHADCGVDQLR